MRLRRGLATLIGTLLATVALPAAAHADSIVYLKGGQVWIANADGSGARAFTLHRYGWASPSEADNGTVVVAGGLSRVNADGTDTDGSTELYRFAPDGNQIGKPIPTYGSYSSPSCPYYPPSSVRVSPDGSRIAYGILDCGAGGENVALWTPATATGLSFPNQTRGQVDFTEPIWIDNNRFTISHSGPPVFGAHFGEHAIGDGDNVGAGWSEPAMDDDTAHAVISRSGKFAAVFYEDSAGWTDGKPRSVALWLYSNPAMPADFTAGYGDPICKVTLNASKWVRNVSATLSPDGTKLLWGDSAGVEVAPVTSGCAAVVPHLLVPGGSEPFYARGNMQKGAAHPHQPGSGSTHATFKVKTKHPRAHRKVKFAGGGHMHSYRWKFGDGRTGKGRNVSHKYRKAGRYTVTLTVTDSSGAKAKVKHKIRVKR
jgi:hypothetical protein